MKKDKKEKDPIGFFKICKMVFPIIFKVAPVYFTVQQVIAIAHGASHALLLVITRHFFDSILGGDLKIIFAWFAIFTLLNVAREILNGVHNFTHQVLWQRIAGYNAQIIHRKSSRIDPIMYEDPSKLDDLNKAFEGSQNIYMFVMIATTLFDFYVPYFILTAFFLYSINPLLVFAIVISFIPALASQLVRTKIMSKLEDIAAPIRRENESHEGIITSINFMKETRILGAFGFVKRLYVDSMKRLNKKIFQARVKSESIYLVLNIVSAISYGGVIVYVIYLLLQGEISVGSFAAIYTSMGLVFAIMDEIVNRHLGNLSSNYGTIRNFIRFLDMSEISGESGEMDSNPAISIDNVSFKYPNAENNCLTDISLHINPGETIAIVGENGAGKTTLVKLITGIYRPTEGDVTVGGLDVKKVTPKCIYDSITGVFQKYQRYKMTLDENVRISQVEKDSEINSVMRRTGVDIDDAATYPEGTDTMLSREFDGVDLSGGQWQRVALARGFYRDHKMIVLDEPTAAIDPIEESRIYKQFIEIAADKTAIIVTHRMGSATIADRVVVMEKGKINDIGTHDELLSRKGLYYEMYNAQSHWYEGDDGRALFEKS